MGKASLVITASLVVLVSACGGEKDIVEQGAAKADDTSSTGAASPSETKSPGSLVASGFQQEG